MNPEQRQPESVESDEISSLERRIEELRRKKQEYLDEERRYEQQQFNQQPHFYGAKPGSELHEALRVSRKASQDLMKQARERADKIDEQIGKLYIKLQSKKTSV